MDMTHCIILKKLTFYENLKYLRFKNKLAWPEMMGLQ